MSDNDDIRNSTEHLGQDFASRLADLEETATADELAAITALPAGSALLIVRRGPTVGARFLLDSDVTVAGRHPDADIFLDDVTVSRRHAEIVRDGKVFSVRDLDSLNGTYLEGARTAGGQLQDGSEIQIGKYRMTFYPSRHDLPAGA
ncbi:MAG: FHA domain-containing protein [Microbacteriaceae bacterium]|nr:FHA domain-containing protein [Microbacteriaceae bacterium]